MRTLTMLKVPAGLIAAVLSVASLAPTGQAQDLAPGFATKINVPFPFETAMGQHFARGLYTISTNGGKTMLLRGAKTSGLVLTQLADNSLPATRGKAVFTRYGDKYFLRSVWVAGNNSLFCGRSKAEHQLQVAAAKTPTAVELALLLTGR
jgi:hypothetical protein